MTAFRDILRAARRPVRPIAAPWRPMRQRQAAQWAVQAPPGQALPAPEHRAMRLLVEAMELARSTGVGQAQMQSILRATFSHSGSDARRSAGGVGVALLMVCEALNLDADATEVEELNRVLSTTAEPPPARPAVRPRYTPRARAPAPASDGAPHPLDEPAHAGGT